MRGRKRAAGSTGHAEGAPPVGPRWWRFEGMRLQRIVRDCRGQDLAEYALLITLITLALVTALTLIATSISNMFDSVAAIF